VAALRPETQAGIEAVTLGLKLASASLGDSAVSSKGVRDIVTEADVAVEDAIRERLAPLGYPVVGEERGGEMPADGSPYWLVDPICGTTNFAFGIPMFAVNLALVEGGTVITAIVGDGSRHEIAFAERGAGASVLKDGVAGPMVPSVESATIVADAGKWYEPRRAHAASFFHRLIATNRWDCIALATSLALVYVAAGRVAGYAVFYVGHPLHAAAGAFLIEEAGGTVTDLDGQPWDLRSETFLAAATPQLHAELLTIVQGCKP
jgi:myo-inositol-1(or 4)-monophosphatase